ncbi:lipoprotein [Pelomonas sp. Root1217]|uniref:LPS translocon maturation chaperone LptM n=1 Tax=Pelomonas sp. Root1217 TaxID=1736430 RepID=UPI0009EA9507
MGVDVHHITLEPGIDLLFDTGEQGVGLGEVFGVGQGHKLGGMNKTAVSVGGGVAALLITLTALTGCGQKGPLTLPQPAGAASAPASGPAR